MSFHSSLSGVPKYPGKKNQCYALLMANASDAGYDMGKKFIECEVWNGIEKATWKASVELKMQLKWKLQAVMDPHTN